MDYGRPILIGAVVLVIGALAVFAFSSCVVILNGPTPEIRTINEIRQLEIALAGFHAKFGFYPPDRIRLCRYRIDYSGSKYDVDSLAYVSAMWPDIEWVGARGNWFPQNWDGLTAPTTNFWDLEGDQCLVFFLGGIPGPGNTVLGFSTSKTNPTQPDGHRLVFYEFEAGHLYQRVKGNPFLSYRDCDSDNTNPVPYAYFSSGKRRNGYNISHAIAALNISPYFETSGAFYNPHSFQIICAGPDGKFGGGGGWSAESVQNVNEETKDNLSNFHPYRLGVAETQQAQDGYLVPAGIVVAVVVVVVFWYLTRGKARPPAPG